jgi:OPT family oligopeptide transporter
VVGAWVFFLGCLGVSLAVPMKRSMINREKLKFPSGMAAAVTLQGFYSSGKEALQKAKMLGLWALISAIWKLFTGLNFRRTETGGVIEWKSLVPGESNAFDWIKSILPSSLKIFSAHGPASIKSANPPMVDGAPGAWNLSNWTMELDHGVVLIAAGILIGLRTTAWMLVGGLFLAFVLGPMGIEMEWTNPAGKLVTAVSAPHKAWKEVGIWLGAPMIVTHGLTSFATQWRSIARSFSGFSTKNEELTEGAPLVQDEGSNYRTSAKKPTKRTDVEVPMAWFMGGVVFAAAGLMALGQMFFEIPFYYGALAVFMTFFLALVSCRVTGETDITPGSAMGKLMQLTYGVLIPQSMAANLMTASVTSGAGIAAADLLTDLKTGYLLGANPRRQFIAQASGILTGTIASVGSFYLLVPNAATLLGGDPSVNGGKPAFAAPGAQAWRAVAELFRYGIGNLHPFSRKLIIIGASVGIMLALFESFFPKHKKWIPSASGFGLGLILPFPSPFAMFIGALIADIAPRINKVWADKYLVPISAGTIAGESIMGVICAGLNSFVFH